MNTNLKKALFILAGVSAAVVLAAVIFVLTFDINRYKPSIEEVASEATGMKVRVNGKLKLALFPNAGITLENILIQNQGAAIASAEKAEVEIKLLPLVRRKILIRQVGLINLKLFITKDRREHFNFEVPEKRPAGKEFPREPFEIGKISIKKGQVLYQDEKSVRKSEANECDLAIKNFAVGGGESVYAGSFAGDLSCEEVKTNGLKISDFRVAVKASGGNARVTNRNIVFPSYRYFLVGFRCALSK